MLSIDWKRDKNGINTGLFHIKTGLLGNGRKTPFSISANTKTGSRKYGNGRKNIENGTGRYGKNYVRFHPYWCIQNNFWAYGTYGANHAPIMHRNDHYLQKGWKELLHDPRHLGVPLGASKMIYEAMVRLVQIGDVSSTETNTISKWTETRFYMTHVT
jgi:hypothetical protein